MKRSPKALKEDWKNWKSEIETIQIVENGQNTEKSPAGSSKFAVTQSPVKKKNKKKQPTLVGKTCKELNYSYFLSLRVFGQLSSSIMYDLCRTHRSKRREYNDEDNCSNTLRDKNHPTSSQKFWQIKIVPSKYKKNWKSHKFSFISLWLVLF